MSDVLSVAKCILCDSVLRKRGGTPLDNVLLDSSELARRINSINFFERSLEILIKIIFK